MKRFLLACIAAFGIQPLLVQAANELDVAEKRPTNTQAPDLIDESENFAVHGVIADRVSTSDTDKFKRDTARIGAMVHYASPYEFIAIGASRNEFRQGNWSAGVNSLVLAGRSINRRTGEGYTGWVAVTTNTEKTNWHGEGTWNIRFSERTGAELIGSRDAVETVGALTKGNLAPFGRWTLRDNAAQRRLAPRNGSDSFSPSLLSFIPPPAGMKVQTLKSSHSSDAPRPRWCASASSRP